jgi:predicted ribonuclease YlaK
MKQIAFKRAKHSPVVASSLHPEFITEFADTKDFPKGFHKAEDGWEVVDEAQFQAEIALNDTRHQEFLDKKRETELAEQKVKEAEAAQVQATEKQIEKEYEEFKAWKLAQKNKRR